MSVIDDLSELVKSRTTETQRAYLQLHLAVLLYGFTAILGDLIQLSAVVLVWWRVFITSISLFLLIGFGKTLIGMPRKLILKYMGVGVLVGLHWITFFGAIKYSNASICLVCMATTSFFTAFVEPLFTGSKFKLYEIGIGLLIIPGMVLVVNNIDLSMQTGIWIGLLSALLASIFATLNKVLINQADTMTITFLELSSACLFITCLFPFFFMANPDAAFWPSMSDLGYLLVLALLCTTFAYILGLNSLKHLSAFAANLTVNLEPVYGIILAWIILKENEELSSGFYLGGVIIILAVLFYPLIKRSFEREPTA